MKKTVILNSVKPGKKLDYNYPDADRVIKFIRIISAIAFVACVILLIANAIW